MRKRILSIIMALCMVVSVMPTTALAMKAPTVPETENSVIESPKTEGSESPKTEGGESPKTEGGKSEKSLGKASPSATWDGKTKTAVTGAEIGGAAGKRYTVSTASELAWIADKVNIGELGDNYKVVLEADINLGKQEWTPIGTEASPFKGEFIGNGHTIKGLKISKHHDNAGLFGVIDGANTIVSDLTVTDGSVEATGTGVGGIVGLIDNATVRNCHNAGVTISRDITNVNGDIGGIAGKITGTSLLQQCSNGAKISDTTDGGYTGGIVGKIGTGGEVVTCGNIGEINLESSKITGYAGGVAGINNGNITNCMSSAAITGYTAQVGGVAGLHEGGTISHSYSLSTEEVPTLHIADCHSSVTGCGIFPVAGGIVEMRCDYDQYGGPIPIIDRTYVPDDTTGAVNAANAWVRANSGTLYWSDTCVPCLTVDPGDITPAPTPPTKLWDGSTKTPVTGVAIDGATGKRYTVSTGAELAWIADEVNNKRLVDPTDEIVLSANIMLQDKEWTPIGNAADAQFNGKFDGQGHSVKRLRIGNNAVQMAGLFGRISSTGVVQNLVMRSGTIASDNASGAGSDDATGSVAGYSEGKIINCHNIEVDITLYIIGDGDVGYGGGIVGENNGGIVNSCSNRMDIATQSCTATVGAIVGINRKGQVVNCSNTGFIELGDSSNNSEIGGIAGVNSASIVNCVNYGGARGIPGGTNGNSRGGLVGVNDSTGSIDYSYTTSISGLPADMVGNNSSSVTGCGTFAEVGGAITLINDRGSDGAELTTKTETYVTDGTTGAIDAANAWVRSPEGIAAGGKFWTDSGLPTLDADPSTTPPTPDPPSHGGSYYSEEENKAIDSRDFWATVRKLIAEGKKGEVVMADARDYDNMPDSVMEALRSNPNVALEIEHKNGKITIAAGKAAKAEAGRIHYPFALLTELYSGTQTPTATGKLNPDTGR